MPVLTIPVVVLAGGVDFGALWYKDSAGRGQRTQLVCSWKSVGPADSSDLGDFPGRAESESRSLC